MSEREKTSLIPLLVNQDGLAFVLYDRCNHVFVLCHGRYITLVYCADEPPATNHNCHSSSRETPIRDLRGRTIASYSPDKDSLHIRYHGEDHYFPMDGYFMGCRTIDRKQSTHAKM